jgi:5'-nucleotidase
VAAEAEARNRWVLKGMLRMGYAAINLGTLEVIRETERFKDLLSHPELPLLSANATRGGESIGRPPYIVRELPAREPGRPRRVGFLGLTQNPDPSLAVSFSDPVAAAAQLVPELREKVDLLVALGSMRLAEAKALIERVPGIDVLVGAAGERLLAQPQLEGQTLVVYAGEQGMFLGELRLFLSPEGRADRYFHRLVPLSAAIEDDVSLADFQKEAEAEIVAAQQK